MQWVEIKQSKDHPGVAILSLMRTDKHNALNRKFIDELIGAFEALKLMDISVCLIQSASKHFCVGADIQWMQQSVHLSAAENQADSARLAELFKLCYELPIITIACVQGCVYGGGIGLVSCCDFVLASEQASFCFSEMNLGLIPATIMPYVAHKILLQKMRWLFMTAEVFDAEQACDWGLVDQVYSQAELQAAAWKLASQLAHKSLDALAQCKQALAELTVDDDALIERSLQRLADLRVGEDAQEGLQAFLEKRKPHWRK